MTRKKIVAGNWKMNLLFTEAVALAESIKLANNNNCDVVIAPPFIYNLTLSTIANNNGFHIAAQNCSENIKGAFTGEVSAAMLASIGTKYVIVGHSERRSLYGETNHSVC
jgi:triosephosphate isomerase